MMKRFIANDAGASAPSTRNGDEVEQDREILDLLLRGFQISRMIRVTADLDIAGRLATGDCRPVGELAAMCGVSRQPLLRILRALAAFGLFRVSADGAVAHSPRSLLLRKDARGTLYHAARFWTAPGAWKAWGALGEALSGGRPYHAAWGTGRFDYLRQHPDEARLFDAFMAHTPDHRHEVLADAYDFPDAGLIVDVGGGNGEALRMILARFRNARGLIFDRPDVVEAVAPDALLGGRIATRPGNFFADVPAKGDVYLLNWILHDWPDEDCRRLLRACRAAMHADARLLIGEHLLEPDPAVGAPVSYLLDTHMMAMFGEARERSETEYRDLLDDSGFAFRRTIATASPFSIIEAVPRPSHNSV